ncbi:hypothetical protein DPMN_111933 [Dreissena polymorpha]|uniref:Uncharacterized protein n=1 Tax=Dreissena polymorpha TaxID=45954 RepID=A0A9D4KES9_DREPO|nr:hypothetical protein DPMN_111933 [Dreissena polymorpha]
MELVVVIRLQAYYTITLPFQKASMNTTSIENKLVADKKCIPDKPCIHDWRKTSNPQGVYKPNVDGRKEDGQRPILKPHLSDQAKNVTSRVFTRKTAPPPWRPYINQTNVFTKFHETIFQLAKNVTSRSYKENCPPPPGGHVFRLIGTIFKLI